MLPIAKSSRFSALVTANLSRFGVLKRAKIVRNSLSFKIIDLRVYDLDFFHQCQHYVFLLHSEVYPWCSTALLSNCLYLAKCADIFQEAAAYYANFFSTFF
eukprot:TRINITY_DN16903_c0_g1_i1.p1 TRINITY_DN16903_c0_g1~~TRINITY_DN16903_c0_g1_i1.p1  ORF type:complete len:101 (+),score=1.30 TRINITY_DN16903_c0_g1_i1:92-394(+)